MTVAPVRCRTTASLQSIRAVVRRQMSGRSSRSQSIFGAMSLAVRTDPNRANCASAGRRPASARTCGPLRRSSQLIIGPRDRPSRSTATRLNIWAVADPLDVLPVDPGRRQQLAGGRVDRPEDLVQVLVDPAVRMRRDPVGAGVRGDDSSGRVAEDGLDAAGADVEGDDVGRRHPSRLRRTRRTWIVKRAGT